MQANKEDNFSDIICFQCWESVNTFHSFYQRIQEIHDKKLKQQNVECNRTDIKQEFQSCVFEQNNDLSRCFINSSNCDIKSESDEQIEPKNTNSWEEELEVDNDFDCSDKNDSDDDGII